MKIVEWALANKGLIGKIGLGVAAAIGLTIAGRKLLSEDETILIQTEDGEVLIKDATFQEIEE